MPGTDARESQTVVMGELPEFPFLVELPELGPAASMVGRTTGVISGLGFDLQPAGWRLTDAAGLDQRRARSLLVEQLDILEELAEGYRGRLKVQVAGPWTLAATMERPRGDRLIGDHGACRELAQALADGVRSHVEDVRRRVPGAQLVVQVDEPALPGVLAAQIPTASGLGRHRSVDAPVASAALGWVFDAVRTPAATPVLHCCAVDVPVRLVVDAGAAGVSIDVERLGQPSYDAIGETLSAGGELWLGVLPTAADPERPPSEQELVTRVLRLVDQLGFDLGQVADQLVITPTCGLARASPTSARGALAACRTVAAAVAGDDSP